MRDYEKELHRADAVLWVGTEAVYVWDKRAGVEAGIPFTGDALRDIPYVPKLHDLWEDAPHYQEALRDIVGGGFFRKKRILVAVPQDATTVEVTALEDFVRAALGASLKRGGLWLYPQSIVLRGGAGTYVALNRSCRCYSVALVRDGEVAEEVLLDAQTTSRSAVLSEIRAFRGRTGQMALEICYPLMEEDRTIVGLGAPVAFAGIAVGDYTQKVKEFA